MPKNEKKHLWMTHKLFFRFRITLNLMKIEDGKIDKEQILMRFGPCLCKLDKTSCEKNENCSKFSLFSNLDKVPKSRAWQPRALKI